MSLHRLQLYTRESARVIAEQRRTMLSQVMSLDKEHNRSIKLLMAVHKSQKISRIPLCEHLQQQRATRNAYAESQAQFDVLGNAV